MNGVEDANRINLFVLSLSWPIASVKDLPQPPFPLEDFAIELEVSTYMSITLMTISLEPPKLARSYCLLSL